MKKPKRVRRTINQIADGVSLKEAKNPSNLRDIKYSCGCHLKEEGINLCTKHLVIFQPLLDDYHYNKYGWGDISEETYQKIVHCLNDEEQERLK